MLRKVFRQHSSYVVLTLASIVFVAACGTHNVTVRDALVDKSGVGALSRGEYVASSVEITQQRNVSGGRVVLYRWKRPHPVTVDEFCGAISLVTPILTLKGNSWLVRATYSITKSPLDSFGCLPQWSGLVTNTAVIEGESVAFGFASSGSTIRIFWSDGRNSQIPVINQSFLEIREGTAHAVRFELLDSAGNILSKEP